MENSKVTEKLLHSISEYDLTKTDIALLRENVTFFSVMIYNFWFFFIIIAVFGQPSVYS
ncbi:hypothetical protein ES705_40638 [subsurface metagenome]